MKQLSSSVRVKTARRPSIDPYIYVADIKQGRPFGNLMEIDTYKNIEISNIE